MSSPRERTVLVLQHISCEPPAAYEDILVKRGYGIQRVELDEGEQLPETHDFAAVIVMGGPMGARDDIEHPWLLEERDYISTTVTQGIPYWGVCLGAQLLAASLGSPIYKGSKPEVGTYDVQLSDEGTSDVVFKHLPKDFSVFQWHSDTFDLPPDARRLVSSELYQNQVFAVGSAYGIQFHVEVGTDLAAKWAEVDSYQEALESLYGKDGGERIFGELAQNSSANGEIAAKIFEAWLDEYVEQ